jgi:vesicle-fusing ATPase
VAVSPLDFPASRDGNPFYVMLNDIFVLTARQFEGFPQGQLSLSDPQRTWAGISLQDIVNVRLYDPFSEGSHRYIASIDAEVGFAGRKTTEVPFDQDELAALFTKVCLESYYKVRVLIPARTMKTRFLPQVKGSSWTTRAYPCYL